MNTGNTVGAKTDKASSTPSITILRKCSRSSSGVQQLLVIKEEDSSEWSPSMDQKNPEPRHIKEEQEELWTSQDGEQLHGVVEADITRFAFTAVTVKSEDDEEKPQISQLHQSLTEDNREAEPPTSSSATQIKTETDREDCGGSEPARNRDPDSLLPLNTDENASDCSETDVSSGDWQESLSDSGSGCDVCGKKFSELSDLKKHQRVHTEEKPFACEPCGKRFSKLSHFNRHKRIHTGEKPFGCDVCGRKFNDRGNFQNHMRVHTGEKPFGCDDCGKRFSQQTNLKAHMRVHTGDKPFGCDLCGIRFTFQTNLAKHMRVHTGEKPFGCADCGKRFRQKTVLGTHMRVHTGERPFGCEVCGKRFTQRGHLSKHMKLH